ncbi:hypothetical protein PVAG01_04205 [Phlyctema vagabunda]|uniref:Uncharacterized protein n=1 Tax=Phlyctema vagabunda TaxID=108571 RepID=A0ABR4PNM9_9HELO
MNKPTNNAMLGSTSESDPDSKDELPVFNIQLNPSGDEGSGFHFQNDPKSPYQRQRVVERRSAVDIRCSCVDIIHGLLKEDGENYCTLLVLEFRFDPRKRARRIAQVDIELRFLGDKAGASEPNVHGIAPEGRFSFAQTMQSETTTIESDVHIGGGITGLDAGGAVRFGRETSREMNHATTVTGSTNVRGRNYGDPNSVSWTLLENPATKTGVPVAMKTAVLLTRKDEKHFKCVISVKAKADWRTSLEWVAGSTKPDDPVLFDPTLDPTSDKYSEMELKLGELDLDAISAITMTNIADGVVNTKKFGEKAGKGTTDV